MPHARAREAMVAFMLGSVENCCYCSRCWVLCNYLMSRRCELSCLVPVLGAATLIILYRRGHRHPKVEATVAAWPDRLCPRRFVSCGSLPADMPLDGGRYEMR